MEMCIRDRLCTVMAYGKKRRTGICTFATDIPEAEYSAENSGKRRLNEIASTGDTVSLNLVTRAFNLFARGGKAGPILSLLFAKIGEAVSYTHLDVYKRQGHQPRPGLCSGENRSRGRIPGA